MHSGAVIVPAVLAIAERHGVGGKAALEGIAVGIEIMCRLGLVAPKMVHKAGFHPTAVFGAMGAAAAVGKALGLDKKQIVDAFGVVGSMASGIIEYLAEGTWTKRMHAGWAAQSGMRAALFARAGFSGPRTVFEGSHGFFHGFANTTEGDFDAVTGDFGTRWLMQTLAFKLYPCGTMTHPYIDCARRLGARGIKPDDVVEMVCDVGEGTVHRLWEPLAAKQTPKNGYAGKFSQPYCIAAGFIRGNVGLSDFSDAAVSEPAIVALAKKVRYRIDPDNPYPNNFTGHIRATLARRQRIEERQPHMRGGAHEPLTPARTSRTSSCSTRATAATMRPARKAALERRCAIERRSRGADRFVRACRRRMNDNAHDSQGTRRPRGHHHRLRPQYRARHGAGAGRRRRSRRGQRAEQPRRSRSRRQGDRRQGRPRHGRASPMSSTRLRSRRWRRPR